MGPVAVASSSQQIVVVGAGVSGLTSALCLAEAGGRCGCGRPQCHSRRPRRWRVRCGRHRGRPNARPRPWVGPSTPCGCSVNWPMIPATGVRMAPALTVGELTAAEAMSSAARLIPDLRPADPADIPEGFGTGFRATMPMIDMPQYLDYLTRRLAAAGCEIEVASGAVTGRGRRRRADRGQLRRSRRGSADRRRHAAAAVRSACRA